MRHTIVFAALAAGVLAPTQAQEAPAGDVAAADPFTLGQIVVTGQRSDLLLDSAVLNQEAIYTFNRNTLDDAVNIIPGVSASNSGGSRNERLIFVRGFDRFQVPLSIDGIRVYLPADNRLDFGRFLTPDIAEIQVAKGYASVLDGLGAMGGAINLVTRKPTRELEAEARGVLTLDRDFDHAGYTLFGLVGTRQDHWYAQASYARSDTDHWTLPGGFAPTANEDGGERDFSATADWRVNAKFGFTLNDTDEYAISYTRQEGAKNAPLHITDPIAAQRFWAWPYWNIESLYFLSTTALSDSATLRTRVYRNTFDNLLRAFDNRSQTTQTLGRAFNSYYDDEARGGSVELAVDPVESNRLSIAVHYRDDEHVEYQQGFPSGFTEPRQTTSEDTWSVAVEDRITLSPALIFVAGASFDWRNLKRAEEYGNPPGGTVSALFGYPLRDAGGWNAQGRLEWTPDSDTSLHASVSSRIRFPTIFERFSTQFGTAASNPGLAPERATNVEIGGVRQFGRVRAEAAIFYSRIEDAIVSLRLLPPAPVNTNRRENLGSADYYGGEVSLTASISPQLEAGLNYTYIRRDFALGTPPANEVAPVFELTDVPDHKGFAYLSWRPLAALEIVPSVEFASDRTTVTTSTATQLIPVHYDTGSYVQANLRIDYRISDGIELGVGARNLFNEYYALTDGFPEPGRSVFASARLRY